MDPMGFLSPLSPTSFCTSATPLPVCSGPLTVRRSAIRARLELDPTFVRAGEAISEGRLAQFASSVRGEWTGFEGTYEATGELVKVGGAYLPEEFEEWGIEPLGFESNMSMVVRGAVLYRKHFRVLPTVSQFGDLIDLEETCKMWEVREPGFLAFGDGCYTAGKSVVKTRRESRLEAWPSAEFCLRWRGADKVAKGVHVQLSFDFGEGTFVDTLQVIQEKFDTDYCDGSNIEGSSGYVEGWTSAKPMLPTELLGTWETEMGQITERKEGDLPIEKGKALFLPGGVHISVERVDDGLRLRTGWLTEENIRLILDRSFDSNGSLLGSTRVVERRVE